jgi:hypothetical protein
VCGSADHGTKNIAVFQRRALNFVGANKNQAIIKRADNACCGSEFLLQILQLRRELSGLCRDG